MDAIGGVPEYEVLQKLRPREARHERTLIVPPKTDWSGGEPHDASRSVGRSAVSSDARITTRHAS